MSLRCSPIGRRVEECRCEGKHSFGSWTGEVLWATLWNRGNDTNRAKPAERGFA